MDRELEQRTSFSSSGNGWVFFLFIPQNIIEDRIRAPPFSSHRWRTEIPPSSGSRSSLLLPCSPSLEVAMNSDHRRPRFSGILPGVDQQGVFLLANESTLLLFSHPSFLEQAKNSTFQRSALQPGGDEPPRFPARMSTSRFPCNGGLKPSPASKNFCIPLPVFDGQRRQPVIHSPEGSGWKDRVPPLFLLSFPFSIYSYLISCCCS